MCNKISPRFYYQNLLYSFSPARDFVFFRLHPGKVPGKQHCDSFRFRRAAFYNGLKSKVGLAAAKTAAMRINLNSPPFSLSPPPLTAFS